jgi:putative addiction module component (TIGR02574 family)
MSEAATNLLEQLLQLSEADRLMIADRLWDSLTEQDDPEFAAELQKRLESVADGSAELIDGEQVLQEARERLAKRRES